MRSCQGAIHEPPNSSLSALSLKLRVKPRPPARSLASRMIVENPRSAQMQAAAAPASPAPMTTTSQSGSLIAPLAASHAHQRGIAARGRGVDRDDAFRGEAIEVMRAAGL